MPFSCMQAEQALQDPSLVDIRLMRDFSGQRPVDVAMSFGYERLAVLLDPSQPIELLSTHVARGAARLCPVYHTASAARLVMKPCSSHSLLSPPLPPLVFDMAAEAE